MLVLKLEAAENRQYSAHGIKDAKDIIRLLLVANQKGEIDATHVCAYMQDKHFEHLKKVVSGNEYTAMAMGNAKKAKELRFASQKIFKEISNEYEQLSEPTNATLEDCSPHTRG